jgi:hypothetical protein
MSNKLTKKISLSFEENSIRVVIAYLIIFLFLLLSFLIFGDRVGWEGDDVTQLEGIVNFTYKQKIGVYRYYWQPLAYELSLWINDWTKNPRFLFALPQIFAASSICVLLGAISAFSEGRISLLLGFSILLLLPEIFFCGLYYNSTVFGMLPMAIALLFLFWKKNSGISMSLWNDIRYLTIGVASTVGCFFRLDFLLCLPLIWYLIIFDRVPKKRSILLYLSGSILIVALIQLKGFFELVGVFNVMQNHADLTDDVSFRNSLENLFSITNLIVWIALFAYFIYFLVSRIKSQNWKSLLVVFPAAILLYPIPQLVTPKYLIPAIIFLPFVLAKMIMELQERLDTKKFKNLSYCIIVISMLLQILSVEPARAFPYLQINPIPTYIGTHDGPRSLGSYLRGYNQVRKAQAEDGGHPQIRLARRLTKIIKASEQSNFDLIYLDKEGNQTRWSWYWPNFYLQLEGYKVQNYSFSLKEQEQDIILVADNKVVRIKELDEEQYRDYKENEENALIKVPYLTNDALVDDLVRYLK